MNDAAWPFYNGGKMENSVKGKFDSYPDNIRPLLLKLREIILDVAKDYEVGPIEESLKWGEPSYIAKGGSTVRIDWKPKHPHQYFIYFHCQTVLVETFKEMYGDVFLYEGKRAIILDARKKIPSTELRHCISLALRYHKLKNLPLLGGIN